jgi:hypothetical protein
MRGCAPRVRDLLRDRDDTTLERQATVGEVGFLAVRVSRKTGGNLFDRAPATDTKKHPRSRFRKQGQVEGVETHDVRGPTACFW